MAPKKCILYHLNSVNYSRNFQVKDIPIKGVTDIAYAFFNLKDNGGGNYIITSGDMWADFQNPFIGNGVEPQNTWASPPSDLGLFGQFSKLYKETNGSVKMILSIGGWTWSQSFSLAVRTGSSRQSLVNSIVTLFQQWKCFTGINFDWEYLSDDGVNYGKEGNAVDPNDSANFNLFVEELKGMFDALGWKNYTISMCCTAAPEKIKFDLNFLIQFIDEFHIMTYDFVSGDNSKLSAHQSNLYPSPYGKYSASAAVDAYIGYGVPAAKLFIGIPLYSRGFVGTNGLGAPATGPSPDSTLEPGSVDYKSLPISGAVEKWDDVAKAGYSYDATRKVMNTYDVPKAVKAKCDYVVQKGLGGVFVWESSSDAPFGSQRSILKVIYDSLLADNTTVGSE